MKFSGKIGLDILRHKKPGLHPLSKRVKEEQSYDLKYEWVLFFAHSCIKEPFRDIFEFSQEK